MGSSNLDRARVYAQFVLHEGRRLKPYVDTVGKITIGIGHNLTDRGLKPKFVDEVFWEDIADASTELAAAAPWIEALDPVRYRVFLDMAFNMGVPKLMKFRKTLDAARARRYELASVQMLDSKWADDVKEGRALRLAGMMSSGKDSTDF